MTITASNSIYKSFIWKGLQFFISFFLNIFLVRCFQAVIIAEFHSILYVCSFIASVFTLGLDLGITYFIIRKELSTKSARAMILIIVLASLLVTLPILYYWYLNNNSLYLNISKESILLFAALYISGTLLFNLSTAIYTAYYYNYYPAKISFIFSCLVLFASIVPNWLYDGKNSIQSLFIIYFTIFFIQGLVTYLLTFKLFRGECQITGGNLRELVKIIKFSFSGFTISLLFFIGLKMNVLTLSHWIPNLQLGNYTQSYKLVEYIITFVGFIAYPLIAIISKRRSQSRKDITLFLLRVSNTFICIIILLLILTGYWIFPIIFGNSFTEMYTIFIFLIPGLLSNCSSVFFTSYYFGTGLLRYNFISAILLIISALFFLILFVNKLGTTGAAVAFSISGSISLVYDLIIFRKLHKFSISDILFINRLDLKKIKEMVYSNFYSQ